jgi:thiol:disulfide interchange protein DsbD
MVKVDLTKKDRQLYDHLLSKYKVKGVPTVVFLDTSGRERMDLRVVDFIKPSDFLKIMVSLR